MFITSTSEGKVIRAQGLNPDFVSLITIDQISGAKTVTFEPMSAILGLPFKNRPPKLPTTNLQFMSRETIHTTQARIDNLADFALRDVSPCICPVTLSNATNKLLLSGPLLDLHADLGLFPGIDVHLGNAQRAFERYASDTLKASVRPVAFIPVTLEQPSKILYQTPQGQVYAVDSDAHILPVLVFDSWNSGNSATHTGNELIPMSATSLQFLGENRTAVAPYELFLKNGISA